MPDSTDGRARPIGINHVALEVNDVEAALDFYQNLFAVELRGRTDGGAFLDMGDQFVALMAEQSAGVDDHRHLGLVVDDPELVERRLDELGIERLPTSGIDFRDPWGNRVQVVGYEDIQFTKAAYVLSAMGLSDLQKTPAAIEELAEKGMAPDRSRSD